MKFIKKENIFKLLLTIVIALLIGLPLIIYLIVGIVRGRLEFCVNGYNYHEGVDHLCKMLKVS